MSNSNLSPEEIQRAHRVFKEVPFINFLGLEIVSLERGQATIQMNIRDELLQNNGIVHGGAIASLIDTSAAFAILTTLGADQTTTTVDLTIHYLRPLTEGRASATARVVKAGRRIVVVTVDLFNSSEVLAATALTSYMRLG